MHMVSWQKITRPKRYGGLGIKQSRFMNVAMIGKLVWDLINSADKLWVGLFHAKYCSGVDFMHAPLRRGSTLWNAFMKVRTMLQEGFTWRVGEGNLSFWG